MAPVRGSKSGNVRGTPPMRPHRAGSRSPAAGSPQGAAGAPESRPARARQSHGLAEPSPEVRRAANPAGRTDPADRLTARGRSDDGRERPVRRGEAEAVVEIGRASCRGRGEISGVALSL